MFSRKYLTYLARDPGGFEIQSDRPLRGPELSEGRTSLFSDGSRVRERCKWLAIFRAGWRKAREGRATLIHDHEGWRGCDNKYS